MSRRLVTMDARDLLPGDRILDLLAGPGLPRRESGVVESVTLDEGLIIDLQGGTRLNYVDVDSLEDPARALLVRAVLR